MRDVALKAGPDAPGQERRGDSRRSAGESVGGDRLAFAQGGTNDEPEEKRIFYNQRHVPVAHGGASEPRSPRSASYHYSTTIV